MKTRFTLLLTLCTLTFFSLNAQIKPGWYLGLGVHATDFFSPIGGGILETSNWNDGGTPLQLYLGRSLSPRLELGTSFSIMEIDKFPDPLSSEGFWDWDVMAQYHFLGNKVVTTPHWFDPYVWLGGGLTNANDITSGLMNAGAGVDFWLTRIAALNIHTAMDMALGNGRHYVHHGIGVKVLIKACDKKGDRDGDGVPDELDKCPDVAGSVENDGCPEVSSAQKQEINNELLFSAKNIQFESTSDVIQPSSFADLNKIISIMKRFPNLSFDIHGHTDNTGSESLNLDLSKRRAASVKKYFTEKGINASRLFNEGYGQSNPIADNTTPEGRAANRRVEIKVRN